MELRQLFYFVTSAETENFTQASELCHVAQSTLSQQIRQLEANVGAELFERRGKHVSLTPEGRELLPYARKCLADEREGMMRMNDLRHVRSGTLRVSVTYGMSALLAEAARRLRMAFPQAFLSVNFMPASAVIASLKEHKADLALAYNLDDTDPLIEKHSLFASPLCAVVREGHPLSFRKEVRLADLTRYHVVLSTRGMTSRTLIDKLMEREGVSLKVAAEMNEMYTMLHFVRTNNMVAVMSAGDNYFGSGFCSVPLAGCESSMTACLIMLKDSYKSKMLRKFTDILRDCGHVVL